MLKVYNTKTRRKEEFKPVVDGHVGMYVCGPTVYGPPHLGHAKSYIAFDIIHRYFNFLGYKVKYVQNITDVGHLVGDGDEGEDKISRQAKLEKLDPYQIAYKYECEYFDAMDALNILRPSISARATGFIIDIIEAVKEIIDKGYGYVTKEGNVYFDVHKYHKYGQLSNRRLDGNVSGERIEIASDKRHAEDFALWKAVSENTLMKWQSPWGWGCPGWHIECSVLGRKFLGEKFDIHGGGIDNLFPHHECECAQGDVLTGDVPMNYFLHNNLVTVNGTKMGKSLGNSMTLSGLFTKYGPITIRFFVLQFHYRSVIDFSDEAISSAQKQLNKIGEFVLSVERLAKEERNPTGDLADIYKACLEAMDDDFNTPVLLAEVLKLVKVGSGYVKEENKEKAQELLYIINKVVYNIMGLKFAAEKENAEEVISEEVKALAKARWQAKKNKDFVKADEIREKLSCLGYDIKDTKDGYDLIKK